MEKSVQKFFLPNLFFDGLPYESEFLSSEPFATTLEHGIILHAV